MADPLSVMGTAVGVISLAIQACQSLAQYYGSWRDAKNIVATMIASSTALVSMLKQLRTVLEDDSLEDNIRTEVEMNITDVSAALGSLNVELHKCREANSNTFRDIISEHGRRLQYPFRETTLLRLRTIVADMRDNLILAVNVLNT
jgi:hypothetical protein